MGSARLISDVAGQHAPGRQHGCGRWHDDAFDFELACDLDGMQTRRTAETQKREPPRINTTAQRHEADAIGHLQIDHAVDAGGCLHSRQAERSGNAIDGCFCRSRIQRPLASHESGGIEIAENDIGVGHGRSEPAIAVAGWSRNRACAFRANAKRAASIDARNRAASSRDAGDVEAAQRDPLARQHAVGGERGAASEISEMSVLVPPMSNGTRSEISNRARAVPAHRKRRRRVPTTPCRPQAARPPRPAPCRHATR